MVLVLLPRDLLLRRWTQCDIKHHFQGSISSVSKQLAPDSADMNGFKLGTQNLRTTDCPIDFTIKCAGKEFKVHRCLIVAHSTWFLRHCTGDAAALARTCVELDDHPEMIARMINFFYTFDYDDANTEPGVPRRQCLTIGGQIVMYRLAEKFGVADLKALALKKFKAECANNITDHALMMQVIAAVYQSNTAPTDIALRNIVTSAFVLGGRNPTSSDAYRANIMRNLPLFAADLTTRLLAGCSNKPLASRGWGCEHVEWTWIGFWRDVKNIPPDGSYWCDKCQMVRRMQPATYLLAEVPLEEFWK
ncbi:hypothetical protein CLAFUW4_09932 [Fulvia fulva]|nr:hypothetical protein CLAFUR4_09936 [Fulvia fulva]WPV19539.1 hypothetical protein CLAFUW4_09932 [Fulvia fulva]WPV34014.1 hypothetical protein CLAFUW7_09933 [Fulvia fulva]